MSNERPQINNQQTIKKSTLVQQQTYFDLTEACKLFNAREDEHVLETIDCQIEGLLVVNSKEQGYLNVVVGRDPHHLLTANDVFVL